MSNPTPPHTPLRSRLMAAAAAVVLTGAAGFAVVSDTAPVLADPVYVKTTQAMPSFADVVEQVSPAVVSVLVKSRVEPAGTRDRRLRRPLRSERVGKPGIELLVHRPLHPAWDKRTMSSNRHRRNPDWSLRNNP